jgi:hypothetical protein
MPDKIVKIREIRDDKDGESIVNSLLSKGWTLISACQVGTLESMDIVYVVGATEDVLSNEPSNSSKLKEILDD